MFSLSYKSKPKRNFFLGHPVQCLTMNLILSNRRFQRLIISLDFKNFIKLCSFVISCTADVHSVLGAYFIKSNLLGVKAPLVLIHISCFMVFHRFLIKRFQGCFKGVSSGFSILFKDD